MSVISAAEVHLAGSLNFNDIDIAVFAAAVADDKPEVVPRIKQRKKVMNFF
ncbi:MAG: hypothetical protein HYU71_12355 [Bacteroidetes bacterium]|nr:hypothetical protein [Bacteroidota bacterium]